MYQFGNRSQKQLELAHPDLRKILVCALSHSMIDFGISQTARTFEEQLGHFTAQRSKLDPRVPELLEAAKHVITETRPLAEAADIYAYHPSQDIAYSKDHLCYIAGVICATAIDLYNDDKIDHLIRWGGNWDSDGVILLDQNFNDLPHFELYKPDDE